MAYALRFGRATHLRFVRGGIKDILQLGFNIIFNALIFIIYLISFFVLFLVLLFRVVVLWIVVVLSPLIALGIVVPNLKELGGEGGNLQDQFIQNAIAPVKIGLVLSIGYIMFDAFEADKTIHGNIFAGSTMTSIDPNSLPTDILDLQQLMIAVGMVVIIWTGVFAAAEKSAAKGITGTIKGYGEGLGKWIAKLPTYAQVIPVKGKRTSLAATFNKAREGVRSWENRQIYGDQSSAALGRMQEASLSKEGLSDFTRALQSSTTAISEKAGQLSMIQMASKLADGGNTQDKNLAKKLADLVDKPKEMVQEIFKNPDSAMANAFRSASLTKEELLQGASGEKKEEAAKSGETPAAPATPTTGVVVKDKTEAATALKDKQAGELAQDGSFHAWAAADIEAYKKVLNALGNAAPTLTVDDAGQVAKIEATTSQNILNLINALNGKEKVTANSGNDWDAITRAVEEAQAHNVDKSQIDAVIDAKLNEVVKVAAKAIPKKTP
jgi:hypothetical protein